MKVLHKLKSRVARRKALEKEAALKSPRPSSPIDFAHNNEIAAEVTRRRERFKARNKKPFMGVLPLDEDLSDGILASSGLPQPPQPPPHIGYLGIGTGSQYHVPKHDSDADYVAASPTMMSFNFNDLAPAPQTNSLQQGEGIEDRFCLSSSQQTTDNSLAQGVDFLVAPMAAVRVDSGFEDVPGETHKGSA